MAFSGKLDEISPSEVFQLISLTRKTGMLAMSNAGRQGVVVFKEGKIVFAASDKLRATFGESLTRGGIVGDEVIVKEVEGYGRQAETDSGRFLVELRKPQTGGIEEVVRKQIELTVRELVGWQAGTFIFDAIHLPAADELSLDADKFLDVGVSSEELLLNALAKLDEEERGRWQQDLEAAAAVAAEPATMMGESDISAVFQLLVDDSTGRMSWVPAAPPPPEPEPGRDLATLRRLVPEMKEMSPALTAESTLLILRFAAQVVNRGVVFAVAAEGFQGIGQFGLVTDDGQSPDERVRSLWVPRSEVSILWQVAESRQSYRGVLQPGKWNSFIANRLGDGIPGYVVAVPLVVDANTVAIFYGDNLPESTQVCAVDGLDILMHEIGLSVEKARLERQLQAMQHGAEQGAEQGGNGQSGNGQGGN